MYAVDLSNTSFLDELRMNNGIDTLKTFFHHLAVHNTEKAINLINDKNLYFSSLFVLQSEVSKLDLFTHLNTRNQCALEIIDKILTRKNIDYSHLSSEDRQMTYELLRWIIETGYMDDGLNNQYDEVIDAVAVLLIKIFKDKNDLHIVLEIIFNRYKKGSFIYDLVWAFFESRDAKGLILIANRLCSNHWKDIELARKLLKFIPYKEFNFRNDNVKQYLYSINWINDNYPFLYYTGECFQQKHSPKPYAVSLEAKYLCKAVTVDDKKTSRSITDDEYSLLDKYRILDSDSKLLLSDYSFLLYRQNRYWWNVWLHLPVMEQLRNAKIMLGGGLQ